MSSGLEAPESSHLIAVDRSSVELGGKGTLQGERREDELLKSWFFLGGILKGGNGG